MFNDGGMGLLWDDPTHWGQLPLAGAYVIMCLLLFEDQYKPKPMRLCQNHWGFMPHGNVHLTRKKGWCIGIGFCRHIFGQTSLLPWWFMMIQQSAPREFPTLEASNRERFFFMSRETSAIPSEEHQKKEEIHAHLGFHLPEAGHGLRKHPPIQFDIVRWFSQLYKAPWYMGLSRLPCLIAKG